MTDKHLAQQTLIVGLGKTGYSCAHYLAAHGEPFIVTDSRDKPPYLNQLLKIAPNVGCYLGGFEPYIFDQARRVFVSPGISIKQSVIANAQQQGAQLLGDIALFAQNANAPIIAITGSNGKSTVTALLGEMAKTAGKNVMVGGNIGTPVLDMLLESEQRGIAPDFYIVEVSSFQMETTPDLNAYASVVLNVTPDHMDRYASVQEYAAAKKKVYEGCRFALINRDDEIVKQMFGVSNNEGRSASIVRSFGLDEPQQDEFGIVTYSDGIWLQKGSQKLICESDIKIKGRHNIANSLAALALGDMMELPHAAMIKTLKTFCGLPHRMQWVASVNGVNWYNDSKGTNVGATVASISGMPGKKVLIAGGDGKGADFSPLREAVIAHNVTAVVLIGRDAPLIEQVLKSVVQIAFATDMKQAVEQSSALAEPGDSVILSPACASFDMFSDFTHRGDVFTAQVKALQGGEL